MNRRKTPIIAIESRNIMKKIDKSKAFITEYLSIFQCPVCQSSIKKVEGYQIICDHNHHFDLSKKGTLHFLLKPAKTEYTRNMLLSRQRIAQSGFWGPLLDKIYQLIPTGEGVHLDAGCGEGSHSAYLKASGLSGSIVAFDLSKEGINLAAATYKDIFFLVADLAQSPFASNQFDTIINILSPSNYREFKRVLKTGGQIIKAVPGRDYLKELRQLTSDDSQNYSNKEVIAHFEEQFPNHARESVNYTFELAKQQIDDFINMTPLGWYIEKTSNLKEELKTITIDMELLIGYHILIERI